MLTNKSLPVPQIPDQPPSLYLQVPSRLPPFSFSTHSGLPLSHKHCLHPLTLTLSLFTPHTPNPLFAPSLPITVLGYNSSNNQATKPRGHHVLHIVLGRSATADTAARRSFVTHPSRHVPSLLHTNLYKREALKVLPQESSSYPTLSLESSLPPPTPPPQASTPIFMKMTPDFYLQPRPSF